MRGLVAFSIILGLIACSSPQENDPTPTVPLKIELRKTLEEIQDIPAFLDVEILEKEGEELIVFSFEIQGNTEEERLVPASDLLICSLLSEQLKYGMEIPEDCASGGYYYRYLSRRPTSPTYRLNVTISGQVKERSEEDLFTGLPIVLDEINKIESCPVEISENPNPISLENQFWKLVGFTDESKTIISYPTCENPNVGIIFHDRVIGGSPIDDSLARSFTIQTEVWIRPGSLFSVYNYSSDSTLLITRAVSASYMPPRPATSPTDNFFSLTEDMIEVYIGLNNLFGYSEPVKFILKGNQLWLSNPANDIHAQFIFDSSGGN